MSLTINGITFPDARAFPLTVNMNFESDPVADSPWPDTVKGAVNAKRYSIEIPLVDTTSNLQANQLRGLAEQNSVLLIESSAQDLVGEIRKAYVKVETFEIAQAPGSAYFQVATLRCHLVGIPLGEGGSARIQEIWDWKFL